MSTVRLGIVALLVVGGAGAGASLLLAQDRGTVRVERARPTVMALHGRGGQIGVMVRDLGADDLKTAGAAGTGVRVEDVDQDGPAARAGLREGDVVVEVDGDRVRSARQFSRVIQETAEGRSVRLGIVRDGQRQTIEVTPEAGAFAFGLDADRIGRDVARSLRDLELDEKMRRIEPELRALEPRLREFEWHGPLAWDGRLFGRMTSPRARLGIQLGDLTPQLAEYFGAADGGVLVSAVTKDSAAEKAGLKAGDVITAIDGDRVRDADDLVDGLRDVEGEVTIGVIRDRRAMTVKATLTDERPRRRVPAGQPA